MMSLSFDIVADIEYQTHVYVGFNGLLIREGLAHHSMRIKSALLSVTSKGQHSVQFQGKEKRRMKLVAKCMRMYDHRYPAS